MIAPIVVEGSFLFFVLSYSDNLNVVLNPHLKSHQVVGHGNLVWIRNLVETEQTMHDAKTVINMTRYIPGNAKQHQLVEDLKRFLVTRPIDVAYLFVAERYNKETNEGDRSVLVSVDLPGQLLAEQSDEMTNAFEFRPEKYDLDTSYTLSFMQVPDTPAGNAMIESIQPFYIKDEQ